MRGRKDGAAAVRRWFALADDALTTHRDRLNRLNVYPVPDADTGSNMLATVQATRSALARTDQEDLGRLLAAAGAHAMASAHGNSGTLLAVLIKGFAEPLDGEHRLTVGSFSRGLEQASQRGWAALTHPVSGTMLSVLDAARDEASRCAAAAANQDSGAAVAAALPLVVAAARKAVAQTEHQLPELTRAHVVDSGGLGLLLLLAALSATVRDEELDHALTQGLAGWDSGPQGEHLVDTETDGTTAGQSGEASPPGVELMCTARLDPLQAAQLRQRLNELGESVILTPIDPVTAPEGDLRWRIHVHTPDPDLTLEAVRQAGPVEDSSTTALNP